MNLTGVKVGDIVKVDKRGRVFHAEVEGLDPLCIRPLSRETYRTADSREVTRHWRLMGRPRVPRKVTG